MPKKALEVKGMDELISAMKKFPYEMSRVATKTMGTVLLAIWEAVPPYPEPPSSSTYRRTGTLGRSLGISQEGSRSGKPDIFDVRSDRGFFKATFGTRVRYAPKVIGDRATEQQMPFRDYWWTLPNTVVQRALPRIKGLFNVLAEELAAFLEREAKAK